MGDLLGCVTVVNVGHFKTPEQLLIIPESSDPLAIGSSSIIISQ